MFAVEGWKLGRLVAQTPPKNKWKRKREEKEERKSTENSKPRDELRKNPFSLRGKRDSRPTTGPDFEVKSSKKSSTRVVGTDKLGDKYTKSSHESQGSQEQQQQKAAKKAKKRHRPEQQGGTGVQPADDVKFSIQHTTAPDKLTPLQQKMQARLAGSQFRHINEKLYTTPSSKALTLFTEQPSLFDDYHKGFRHQVQSWPTNPVDIFIKYLSNYNKSRRLLVADLGCGDAALAQHFHKTKGVKVRSFDLVKVNEFVEACDIAKVPLGGQSVDIAVFCLSLMGTNFLAFIQDACRYTKPHGEIWIAEIKSRFLDPTFNSFIQRLAAMGLKLQELNQKEKMFVIMKFEKVGNSADDIGLPEEKLLKACLYKKR